MAIVLAGSAVSAALAALANWIAANGLGPAGFGLFSLAMAIMTVLQEIGGPALDTAIVRFAGRHAGNDPRRAQAYLRAGFRLKIGISVGLACVLLLAAQPVAERLFEEPDLAPLIRWMALCLVAANLSTIALVRLQSGERFVSYAALRVLVNAAKVVLLAGLLMAGWLSPVGAALGWTLAYALTWMAGSALCRRLVVGTRVVEGDAPYREILGFGAWVMLSGFLFAFHIRTDTLLLGYFGAPEEVGNYAVAWNLMLLLDLVTSSLVVALLPRAARARTPAEFARLRRQAFGMGLAIAVLMLPLFVFAAPLLDLLFPAFPGAVGPFRVLFWSSVVVLLVYPLYLGFYAQDRPGKVSVAYGLLVVTGLVVGFVLIPAQGAMGAAITTLVARLTGAAAFLVMLGLERFSMPKGLAGG